MRKKLLLLINWVIIFTILTGCSRDNQETNLVVEESIKENQEAKVISEESSAEQIDSEEETAEPTDDVNSDDIGKTFIDGNYEYTILEDGTAKLTLYSGGEAIEEVPETIGGHIVSMLGEVCFWGGTDDEVNSIEEIIVPGSIKEIEHFGIDLVFGNLRKITIKDGVKRISAIAGSQELGVTVTIPNDLEYLESIQNIDFNSLEQYGNLYYLNNIVIDVVDDENENVEFKAGTRGITSYAFSNWKGESIEIPEGVVFIAEKAFKDSKCKNYTLPKSLKEIGTLGGKFYGYSNSYAEQYAQEHGITFVTLE